MEHIAIRWIKLILLTCWVVILQVRDSIMFVICPSVIKNRKTNTGKKLGIKKPEDYTEPDTLKSFISKIRDVLYPDLILRKAYKGQEAPNPKVYSRDDKTKLGILDLELPDPCKLSVRSSLDKVHLESWK